MVRADSRGRSRWTRIAVVGLVALAGVAAVLLHGTQTAVAVTFAVNSTVDRADASPGDGLCQTGQGVCTLRAAIQEANARPGADTIQLPAGVYALEIPTLNDDLPETGDFDIHSPLTITGAGPGLTIIDGGFPLPGASPEQRGLDRLLEIHPAAGNVTITGLTLREGFSPDSGGAIENWSPGLLRVETVHVLDSYASEVGGGINNNDPAEYEWAVDPLVPPPSGRIEIVGSTLSGNAAGGGGAAVNNVSSGTVTILNSTVSNNPGLMIPDPQDPPEMVPDPFNSGQFIPDPSEPPALIPAPGVYEPGASAIANEAAGDTDGTIRIANSTIFGNYATQGGGGVLNAGSGTLIVEQTIIRDNTTEAEGGGISSAGGHVTITGSTITGNHAHDGGGIYHGGASDKIGLRSRFTITGTMVTGNEAFASGGGIVNGGDAQATITDVTISGNKAADAGGGLQNGGRASLDLIRVRFEHNEANGEGGGAFTASERLVTIQDSTFSGNHAGVPTIEDLLNPAGANIAGGGGLYTEGGPVTITGSTFAENTATDEGGGLSIDNFGDFRFSDSVIRDNRAGTDGGGVENSGFRVTFERLRITGNRAELDGGGIYNSSSGEFFVLDTHVELNSGVNGGGLANAPDNALVVRGSVFLRNTARHPGFSEELDAEEGGHGGGVYSLADGDSVIENTTISGNTAARGGGGLFHDADGELRIVNVTIWRNSAPVGGGLGIVESDFVPEIPPKPNKSVILRNTIVGGSLQGGSCDWFVSSDGGNLEDGRTCFLQLAPTSDSVQYQGDRDRSGARLVLDAIADNGGPTLTHALKWESLAVDGGLSPCVATDQRGVARPQNGRCDSGAFEFVGPPQPNDETPPETEYLTGPIQDSLETIAFTFTGFDTVVLPADVTFTEEVHLGDGTAVPPGTLLPAGTVLRAAADLVLPDGTKLHATPQEDLLFECRLIETELTEEPEPLAPWDPVPPEEQWTSCASPWSAPLVEEGLFTFEVRAIDRAELTDPTEAVHIFDGTDTNPPETIIIEKPPAVTNSRSATFTFSGIDSLTPPQFLEFECRLDNRDPDLWLECLNPSMFSNLASGLHTMEVRALDGNENMDPTPARYTWHVGPLPSDPGAPPMTCDQGNITLSAAADGWVDEVNPVENYLFETELTVGSGASGNPDAVPPEPLIGENARALFRFNLPTGLSHCVLESATLRLYSEGEPGRTLQAVPLAGPWKESTLTWFNQPGTVAGVVPATADSGEGYREWDVLAHVEAMMSADDPLPNHGWLVRDAHETDPEGEEQDFLSREMPQDPPEQTLPLLVLRFEAVGTPPPEPPTLPADIEPTTVHCGQVITESTLVANDLTGCLGEGLVIGAPNIVLDLGGHSIVSGVIIELGEEDILLTGVRNGGHTNVVIRNGTIRGFGYGVLLTSGTTHNIVEDMTVTYNALAGIQLFDADDGRSGNTVRNNVIDSNGETGVALVGGSENSVVEHNTFMGNGIGVYLFDAGGHRIENNTISGILLDPLLDSDAGVMLEGSSRNVIRNNTVTDTGDAGVIIHLGSHGNLVEGGQMARNGDAGVVILDSDRNQVVGIVAHQESDGGVVISNANDTVVRDSDLRFNPSGVEASNANNLLIEGNDASHSLQAGLSIGNGLNVRVVGNTANLTGGAGISLEGAAFDALGFPVGSALIEGNTADENADDGIIVAEGGHTIRNNSAFNNAGYGINAGEAIDPQDPPDPLEPPNPAANIDGGGNTAGGNLAADVPGEPQCTGVVCDTSGTVPPLTPPDLEPPDTTITSGPLDPSGSTSAVFTFEAVDDHTPLTAMLFECRLDPGPDPLPEPEEPPDIEPPDPGEPPELPDSPAEGVGWVECSSPVHFHGLEQGMHHFEVRALDWVDNFDLTPATYDWDVDLTVVEEGTEPETIAPDTRIASGPAATSASLEATFAFAGSDNATPGLRLTFECRIDSADEGDFDPCTTPATYAGLALGPHTFEVRAIDRRGNVDPTPAVHTWEIVALAGDTTPPETTVGSGPDLVTVRTDATFAFASDDPAATFECSVDGGATFAACTSPQSYAGLAVGAREFQVRATDEAGNTDPTPASFPWTIGSAPVPTLAFCGQVITQSIKLRNDLHDCLWDGLVVGAPNITIDVDGHLIDGKGIAAGIRNDGHDFVTIRNGRVSDYDYGVMLNPGTVGNIVEGMTLELNQEAGIALGRVPHPLDMLQPMPEEPPATFQAGVSGNTLRHNTITANDVGIWLTNATQNTLVIDNAIAASSNEGVWLERSSGNRVEANEINGSSGPGVGLQGSSGNTVIGNTLAENGVGVYVGVTDVGVVGLQSNNNRVEGNVIDETGGSGLEVDQSNGNELIDNIAHHSNGEGVTLYFARDTLVRGNDVRSNKSGISLKNSSDNRLENNDTSESEGTGIALEALSLSNELVGNTSSNNDGAGIYVGDETAGGSGTLIEGNTTNNNNGYGIFVPKVSHVVKDNIANDNGTWGIWVSEGSNGRINTDGGGNRAMGNLGPLDPFTLKPLQCYTVRCEGGPALPSEQIPPDTLIMQGPSDPSTDTIATFEFTGSDNASSVTFECRLDGGEFAPCTSPAEYELALGDHTFAVRAVDLSRNVDETPAVHEWTIEARPPGGPETSIVSGPDLTTVRTEATFAFSADPRTSTFECALDGAAFAACPSPKTYTGLAVGTHELRVRARDQAGDLDATPAVYAWRIGAAPVPAEIGCGEIVIQSILVQNDLLDCLGHGLIIGANGITIDLNGHVIDGTGLDAGVLNNGFDSVTITNGAIHEFDYGIMLNAGTSLNVVSAMRVELNQEAGIMLADADQNGKGNTIRNNAVVSNGVGVYLVSNTRFAVVRDNALGANSQEGVLIEFSSDIWIENNEIANSSGAAIVMMGGGNNTVIGNLLTLNAGIGVAVGEELLPSNGNRIERNIVDEGGGGVAVIDSVDNQILFNELRASNGPGIVIELARNTLVRGNDLSGSSGGIELSEASNNRIEANNASGTLGTGIEVGELSYNNEVIQNTASQNGGEGIMLSDSALANAGNLVDGNIANGNGGDGIGVEGVGHTLRNNTALVNGGWGIYAAVGATDGGGNLAAGNAEPAQCYNINCTLGTVPGSPQTWVVEGPPDTNPALPGIQSHSRNASFTYMGSDDISLIQEIVFECRIDTSNDLAWEDCEYPAEFLNLSPGPHVFEVRAIDLQGSGLADPTPARYEWTYAPLPVGVAPQVILDIVPPAETWLPDAIFTFHSNEPDVTFECKVDFFGYEPCGFEGATYMSQGAFEWGLEETEVGLHTFSVRAIDFEGNVGTPATFQWRLLGVVTIFLDGPGFTPPETPFDPPTGGEVASSTATIVFTANVADATFECSIDLEPFVPCNDPAPAPWGSTAVVVTYTGLFAGDHLLRVLATDAATEVEQLEVSEYEWEIVEFEDVTPPETTIERAPANHSSSTIFEFTGTDDATPPQLLLFECRLDGSEWQECVSPFNLLDHYTYEDVQMAPGQHTFEVRAIDMAEPLDPTSPSEGNVDPTPARRVWTMTADTSPPGTGILVQPPAKVGAETEMLFEFFGTDDATPVLELAFECAVSEAAVPVFIYEPCESPHSVQGLEPGLYTLRIRAVDLAGNIDPTPASRTWEIVAAPVTTITSGPAGRVVEGATAPPVPGTVESAVFVFAADQPGSTFECALDGADFIPCTSPHAFWVVEDGSHEFEVRATNPELVVEDPPAVYEWLVVLGPDATRPNTTITSGPNRPADTNSIAIFTFSGNDNRTLPEDLEFECALDGTSFNSCTSPDQWSDLTRGQHTLLVRARDAAGNFDATPASYSWTVELPPVTTILTGPAEIDESTSATFTFQANVPGSTYVCWLDGPKGPCTSPVTYTGLAGGEHIFAVLATGPAGSQELAWAEWEWLIGDTTPPITTITSGPGLSTESQSATFHWVANETNVTYLCALDGVEPLPCTSPKEFPRLHPGPHTFEVTAFNPVMLDIEGEPIDPEYDPVPATYEWTIIDLEPPDTAIQYGPAATTASVNAYFGFMSDDPTAIVECSLDGEGLGECESPSEFTDLTVGTHTLFAQAVDLAGNRDPSPVVYQWTIVQAASNTPVGTNVTVSLPVPGAAPGNPPATLNFFDVNGAGATTIGTLIGAPPLGAGYALAGGRFYDIYTTADFGEPVTLCIPYDPAAFETPAVRLLQFEENLWIDITTINNPFAGPSHGMVCGLPEAFTLFAVAAGSGGTPLVSIISGPPNPSFSGSATFVFFADSPDTMATCSIDGLPFTPCTSPVTYTHLEEGDQEFMIQAIGVDGQMQLEPTIYEWEVILPPDTTPPNTTITKGAPALTANYIVMFEFAGTDDQTHELEMEFECRLDLGTWESCDWPEEVEVLTRGEHRFDVRAVDMTGNVDPTPATRWWTVVDLSAPDTSIELGPESETEDTFATFEFLGEEELTGEAVSEFECALDNEDFTPCDSPYQIQGLSIGSHVMQVRAKDPDGNVDPSPDFYEWLILDALDNTPPDTFILAHPPALSGPDVLFGFASNEPVEEFECALDGGVFEGCEAVYELERLESGQHTLRVRAIDMAINPNVDPTPASYTWTVLGEPETTILTGPNALSMSYSATFTFESDQPAATFQCAVDGSMWVPCTSPFLAGPLMEDAHEFEVRAVNQFVNLDGEQIVDESPANWEWEILDSSPPDTTITRVRVLGPLDLVEPNSLEFTFTGEDNRTAWFELEFECAIDDGPFEGCSVPHYVPLEELEGGAHTFHVRAVDELDNVDPTPATHVFSTEGQPETTILTGPDQLNPTDGTTASFTFSSDQPGATFECALDGTQAFTPCPADGTFTDVPYGVHELLVRARSPLGTEVDLEPASWEWESGDLTPPTVTIDEPLPPIATESTTVTVYFTGSDDTTPATDLLFQCSLNGPGQLGALVFCTSPVTYSGLLAGDYTFEVQATHLHLLADPLPVTLAWRIDDGTAPETTIELAPPALVALDAPAIFIFSSNEPDAVFECALDTIAPAAPEFSECAGPLDPRAVLTEEAGVHTLLVRAVDPSGNADATPESRTWTVIAPSETTILTGPEGTSTSTSATFTFFDQPGSTYTCALDSPDSVAGFAPCTSPRTVTGLADGEHWFEVRAINALGVPEVTAARREWTVEVVDTTPPDTSFVLTPPATTANTTALFAFAGSDDRTPAIDLTFECDLDGLLDGQGFADCEAFHEIADLSLGAHTLRVRAVDLAGNFDPTPTSFGWSVSAPGPVNTFVGPNVTTEIGMPAGDATVTFTNVTTAGVTTVDALAGGPALPEGYLPAGALFFDVDTTAVYTGAVTVCLSYLPGSIAEPVRLLHFDGEFWIDVTITSDPDAGLVCGEPGELSPFAIATGTALVVPDTSILVGPEAETVSIDAIFEFVSNDPAATFECSLDDPLDWGSCEGSSTFSGLLVGDHELQVRAKNEVNGNIDATPAVHRWTITPLPDTFITLGPDEATESTTATFEFTSDVPGVTFECLLDDGDLYAPCASGIAYTNLAAEEHDLLVRAKDAAGNVDPSPAEYSWEIGFVPGLVTIDAAPPATTESRTASFEFSADRSGAVFHCSLDFAVFAPCVSPKTYNDVPFGAHTFQVIEYHPLAIIEAPITTQEWTIADLSVPDTAIDLGPAAVTALLEATFVFHATEPLATFECSLDSGTFEPCEVPVDYSNLSLGEHTFRVLAIDASLNVDASPASHTWLIVAAPVVTILTGPESETDSRTATFTFAADQAGSTFECSLDRGLFQPCDATHKIQDVPDGEHLLEVVARNAHGVASIEPESYEWFVDAAPPVTSFLTGPDRPSASTTATFTFSANEAPVEFQCFLDGAPLLEPECLSPYGVGGLTLGEHTFQVVATDDAGNVETPPASYTWTVVEPPDTTAPDTTIDTAPPSATGLLIASFTFSSNEPGASFQCSLDTAAFAACASPHEVNGLTVGPHTLRVRAIDAAGNVDQTPASHPWTVVAPPETTIDAGPPSPSTSSTAIFRFSADQTNPTFECSLDGTPFVPCTSPQTITGLTDGSHEFRVRATNPLGAVDQSPASQTWTVDTSDTTPPETTIAGGPSGTVTSTSATFTFTATDAGSTFECALNGAPFTACASPVTFSGLADGEHTLAVQARDPEGNVDATPEIRVWMVDVPPDTTIDSQPDASTEETSATFTFSSDDPNATFECALDLDSTGFAPCTSPVVADDLTVDGHTFEVRARDAAGHVDPTPAGYSWTIVDETAPETTIGDRPAAISTSTSATFTFTSNEVGVTFECALDGDGTSFNSCTSPAELTSLAVGPHTLRVRAKDAFGNVDGTPDSYSWTVDPAPETTLGSGPSGTVSSTSATFTFSSDDPNATFECALDFAFFAACTSPYQVDDLADGSHQFEVQAVDAAGSVDLTPASRGWTVDGPPETTIDTEPAATTAGTSASFTFSSDEAGSAFECALDGPSFSSCVSPAQFTNLAIGEHTFRVRAKDAAGTFDPTPAVYTWTIAAPPDTTIDATPVDPTESTTATFEFSSNQPGATFQCALDTEIFTSCTTPVTYSGLALGSHELLVRAVVAGTVDLSPAEFGWEIGDTTPPLTTIGDGPAATTTDTTATFAFSTDDPDPSIVFECSLDGAPFAVCASPKTYSAAQLAAATGTSTGSHTFEVQARKHHLLVGPEPIGWEWTILDVTAPETTIFSGPASEIAVETPAVFVFTSNEPDATFECALDTPPATEPAFSQCDSPAEFDEAAGEHTLLVRAVDPSENADGSPATFTWTVVGPPTTTISAGPPAVTAGTTATFTFTADQAGVTFACSLDGGAFAECDSPHHVANLEVNGHTFEVQATNDLGVVEEPPASYAWTVEAGAPVQTPAGTTVNVEAVLPGDAGTATLTFDAVATAGETTVAAVETPPAQPDGFLQVGALYYDVDTTAVLAAGAMATICLPYDPMTVADPETLALFHYEDGVWEDVTTANDPVNGLICGRVSSFSPFAIAEPGDTAPPETTIVTGPAAVTGSASATLTFSASEAGSTFECALDGAAFAACASPQTYTGLADGQHTLRVRAIDAAGNVDPTPASRTWTIDTTAPTTTIVSGPNATTSETSASVAFSANDPGATFECARDGAAFAACTSPKQYTGLALGAHTVRVRATDAIGNVGTAASHGWTVVAPPDTTAPQTTIGTKAASTTTETSASFTFSADEPGATFACSLNGAEFGPCSPPQAYTGLAIRDHMFEVRATDQAGNTDLTPAVWIWTVAAPADTTPPETTISGTPPAETVSTEATFGFSANEAGASFACRLDGQAFAACSAPVTYTGLAVGQHTFEVRATDAAGNVDPTPASYAWTVRAPADTTPPETTIASGPNATTTSASTTFGFSANEAGATFQCSRDGAAFAACASPITYSGLAVGAHTFQVRATDAAGNLDQTPAGASWSITAPPNCGTAVTVTANADAWIDNNSSSTNKGTDSILKVMSKSGNNNMRALVRFQLPTAPHGCKVESATLRLYAASYKSGRTIQAIPLNGTWTENGVNWSNQPPTSGTPATTSSGQGWREWNVVTPVQAIYAGGANNGFLIRDAVEGQDAEQQYHAREKGQNPPQLVVRFAPADTEPPDTAIGSNPGAATASTSASFAFTSEAGATFECSLDGAAFAACTSPKQYTGVTAGAHEFRVRAKDAAGNIDPSPASHRWTVDTAAPETTLSTTPPSLTNNRAAAFSFAASEGGSTFTCSLDGAAWTACPAGGASYSNLTDGGHAFSVKAADAVGNADASPATFGWTVDATAPDIAVSGGPAALTNSRAAAFTASSEAGATFQCALDSAAFAPCSAAASLSDLADGAHTFRVRAVDAAGNADASPASHGWTVDATAPAAPSVGATASSPSQVDVTWTTSTDASGVVGYDLYRDGALLVPNLSATSYSDTTVQPNTTYGYGVVARDAAGNLSPPGAPVSVATPAPPDTTAPTAPALTATADTPGQVALGWTASTDEVGVVGYDVYRDGQLLASGDTATTGYVDTSVEGGVPYTYEVVARDEAGNEGRSVPVAVTPPGEEAPAA